MENKKFLYRKTTIICWKSVFHFSPQPKSTLIISGPRQHCVKSSLKCGNSNVKELVQHIIKQVSISESLGNAVFTTAVTTYFEDHPHETFPLDFLSQTTIGACLRAVRVTTQDSPRPPVVKFVSEAKPMILKYLQQAQENIVNLTPVGSTWPHLPGFTDTFNQSARSYRTNLVNSLWMYAVKRLHILIKTEVKPHLEADPKRKPTMSYIHNSIYRSIVRAKTVTNIDHYKTSEDIRLHALPFLESAFVQDLVQEHQTWLRDAFDKLETLDRMDGILREENIKKHPHLFLSYQLFLAQRMERIQKDRSDQGERMKATFQIIPQYAIKRRCVTFGKDPTTELLHHLAQLNMAGDFLQEDRIPSKVDVEEEELEHQEEQVEVLRTTLSHAEQKLAVMSDENEKTRDRQQKSVDKHRRDLIKKEATVTQRRQKQEKRKRKRKQSTKDLKRPSKKQQTSWQSDLSIQKIRSLWFEARALLFLCPKGIQKHWDGVVTTDGVVASWHLLKPTPSGNNNNNDNDDVVSSNKKTKGKKNPVVKTVRSLEKKLYGLHGKEVLFDLPKTFNIVAVDPGHVELIHSVRCHRTEQSSSSPMEDDDVPISSSRRRAKERFLEERHLSTFRLTNKQWAHDTGRLALRERTHNLHRKISLQRSVDILASCTSKTASSEIYLRHVAARLVTAPSFIKLMSFKCTSRWKFETYRKEQSAIKKLSTDLLGGMSPTNTLVVWGNGGFGPTSKGHDSAPNKRLRKLLSRFVPIVMNTEYNTSKMSCCCHVESTKLRPEGYKKRGTVLKCGKCSTLLGRDENAAHNILYIFQHQHEHQGEIPSAFCPAARTKQSIGTTV
jgi:hypothetical protein